MAQGKYDLLIRANTIGITRAQSEITSLYQSGVVNINQMGASMQQLGHHSLRTLAIFKGLLLYRGFGMFTQQIGEGIGAAIEFQKEMARVNSLLLVGQQELQRYTDAIIRLGEKTPLTLGQLATGLYDIVSAGFEGEKALFILNAASRAATAGATDLRTAVQAGIGTMYAYGKTLEDLTHIYDVQFLAVKLGIFEYEQLNQVMGRVVATASLAGQGMETAFAALVAVSRGGFGGPAFEEGSTRVVNFFQQLTDPVAQRKIKELGIAVFNSFGKMRNAIDIVADLQSVLASKTEEQRQATIASIFTNIRSAQGYEVLSRQLEIWQQTQMESIFATGTMEEAASKMDDLVSTTMINMQNRFAAAMTGMVSSLAPALDTLSKMFQSLGQYIYPVIIFLSLLISKYIIAAASSRILAMQEQKVALSLQEEKIAYSILNLQLERNGVALDLRMLRLKNNITMTDSEIMAIFAQGAAISQSKAERIKEDYVALKSINTLLLRQAAIDGEINGLKREQIALAGVTQQLTLQKWTMATQVFAIVGMTAAMYALSAGQREVGAALIFVSTTLQTLATILPIVTTLIQAKTAATMQLAVAEAGATAGISAYAAAAGIAVMVGAMTAAMIMLTSATQEATTASTDFTGSLDDMGSALDDMPSKVRQLVTELVKEGTVIETIRREVEQMAGITSEFGVSQAMALIKTGYMNVGEQGFIQSPTRWFPEKLTGTTDFEMALKSYKYTSEEITKIHEGDLTLIMDVQSKLMGESDRAMRDALTLMIFGQEFGNALIASWDTAGKKMGSAAETTKGVMDYVEKRSGEIRDDVVAGLGDSINEGMVTVTNVTWDEFQKIRKNLSASQYQAIQTTTGVKGPLGLVKWTKDKWTVNLTVEGYEKVANMFEGSKDTSILGKLFKTAEGTTAGTMSEDFKNYLINQALSQNKDWLALQNVAEDGIIAMVDSNEKVALTAEEQLAADAQVVADAVESWSKIGDITQISDAITKMVSRGESLDEAGFTFNGVAGQWKTLGDKWAEIQAKWAALDMIKTFIDVFSTMKDLQIEGVDTTGLNTAAENGLVQIGEAITPFMSGMVTDITDVFTGLQGNLSNKDFWTTVLQSDEVVETVKEAVKTINDMAGDLISAVTGFDRLSEFIDQLVAAGVRLDDAGFYFGGVAGQWETLGENWKKIQKMWMALQIIGTIMDVVGNLATAAQQEYKVGERQIPIYDTRATERAISAQQQLPAVRNFIKFHEEAGLTNNLAYEYMVQAEKSLSKIAKETEQYVSGYTTEDIMGSAFDDATKKQILDMQSQLYNTLLPFIQQMAGGATGGLMSIISGFIGNLNNPNFWDTLFEDTEEQVVKTIEEMANDFRDVLSGASGFSDAISTFVEHSTELESAGFYFKNVAEGWQMLGEEWARIQSYFKMTELINSFIQSAKAMREYGVTLPEQFESNMFALMQLMAYRVLPDFQGVIDDLLENIGSEGFWDALAKGMAEADIRQSNSIVLAPYIVISERADAQEVVSIVHDALVSEAKRAGFTWGGG